MVIAILAEETFREKPAGSHGSSVKNKTSTQHAAGDLHTTRSENKELQATIVWADSLRSLTIIDADVYIDLLFYPDRERISRLQSLLPKPVLVYAANAANPEKINHPFIRILEIRALRRGNRVAVAARDPEQEKTVSRIFDALGWDCRFIEEKMPEKRTPGGGAYLLPSTPKLRQSRKRGKQK